MTFPSLAIVLLVIDDDFCRFLVEYFASRIGQGLGDKPR